MSRSCCRPTILTCSMQFCNATISNITCLLYCNIFPIYIVFPFLKLRCFVHRWFVYAFCTLYFLFFYFVFSCYFMNQELIVILFCCTSTQCVHWVVFRQLNHYHPNSFKCHMPNSQSRKFERLLCSVKIRFSICRWCMCKCLVMCGLCVLSASHPLS